MRARALERAERRRPDPGRGRRAWGGARAQQDPIDDRSGGCDRAPRAATRSPPRSASADGVEQFTDVDVALVSAWAPRHLRAKDPRGLNGVDELEGLCPRAEAAPGITCEPASVRSAGKGRLRRALRQPFMESPSGRFGRVLRASKGGGRNAAGGGSARANAWRRSCREAGGGGRDFGIRWCCFWGGASEVFAGARRFAERGLRPSEVFAGARSSLERGASLSEVFARAKRSARHSQREVIFAAMMLRRIQAPRHSQRELFFPPMMPGRIQGLVSRERLDGRESGEVVVSAGRARSESFADGGTRGAHLCEPLSSCGMRRPVAPFHGRDGPVAAFHWRGGSAGAASGMDRGLRWSEALGSPLEGNATASRSVHRRGGSAGAAFGMARGLRWKRGARSPLEGNATTRPQRFTDVEDPPEWLCDGTSPFAEARRSARHPQREVF
jgi:hypothetical protein